MAGTENRIFYLDTIRVIAILCVVLLHVTGHLAEITDYNIYTIFSPSGYFETFMNNFTRIGVDLFLMLSGALLLSRDFNLKEFYTRRLFRVVKPFLFWSLIFSIIIFLACYFIPDFTYITSFGVYDFFSVFMDTLLLQAPASAVYWFIWIIIYVYLAMPFLNRWIKGTHQANIEYFLIIWLIFIAVINPLNNYYLKILSNLISPIALAVLGYYLEFNDRRLFKNRLFSWILIIVPSVLMFVYSYLVVDSQILFVFHRYSIPVIFIAVGVYTLVKSGKSIDNSPQLIKKSVLSIAVCSYGIYLIHSQLIFVFRKVLNISFPFTVEYIILFTVGFIVSWFIIYILSKIPVIGDYVGVK